MIVTRFHYPLEPGLIIKLDLMIKRCMQKNPKRDALLINEGAESEGKTTLSIAEGYYISEQTSRPFSQANVFFDIEKFSNFLQNTEEQIAIWDEPALSALSSDWNKKAIKDLTRLLMMCRKKRHFVIINMTYFNKFNDYLVWQRPLGMAHVYSRKDKEAGRFVYIRRKNLEKLWLDWNRKKQRNYRKYASRKIRGTFPDVLNPDYKNNVLAEFDVQAYEKAKDAAIQMVGKEESNKNDKKWLRFQYAIHQYACNHKINKERMAKELGISARTLYDWGELKERYPNVFIINEE